MPLTKGGYELGVTQAELTDGVRKYYDRQQEDRNLLLGSTSGIVNHHFGIGHFPPEPSLDQRSQSDIAKQLNELELNQIDVLIGSMGAVRAADRVIDAGCGRGGTAFSIAERTGARVDGVTISSYQREFAAALAKERRAADQVRFHRMNYLDLAFEDDTFDHAITNESTQYVRDVRDLIGELARVLRPGGRYTCATWCSNEETAGDSPYVESIDLHYGTSLNARSDYMDALEKNGFGSINVADQTELAIPYWELRTRWQHRSGVELDFLFGHRERKILYLFISATLEH